MNKLAKMNIVSFSLERQNKLLQEELMNCICDVVDKGVFILNQNVKDLETKLAELCNVQYGIGVASGSDALYLSLVAAGVGQGDEVITTPFTFFATAGSISRVGAKPVFVDISPDTLNLDGEQLEQKITPRTKAIIPVHLYGCPAEMDMIMQIANKYRLIVIEDAAQAIGAKYKEQMVGSFGEASCFSFFPTKNLGSFGDGGMVVTKDKQLADRIRLLRSHGSKVKYDHQLLGCNSRLDELQAAILNVKIKYLEKWTLRRRQIASIYTSLLQDKVVQGRVPFKLPLEPRNTYHVFHQYTIQTSQRDQLQKHLSSYGIGTAVYYPIPLHLQKVYATSGYRQGDFPVAETACKEVLSLPIFPELADDEVAYVAKVISDFFS